MNFFWNKKPTIDSIEIPDFGWLQKSLTKPQKQWVNQENTMLLSVNFFELEPDISSLKDVDRLREGYRQLLSQLNGGIIEVNVISIKEVLCAKKIFKFPQDIHGMTYLGSITVPFKNYSYVIKIQANEVGTTGVRDSIIFNKMFSENTVSVENDRIKGWSYDPYDSSIEHGILMNKSEESIYDEQFLEHPLTQVRKKLLEIETKMEFKPEIFKLKKFEK